MREQHAGSWLVGGLGVAFGGLESALGLRVALRQGYVTAFMSQSTKDMLSRFGNRCSARDWGKRPSFSPGFGQAADAKKPLNSNDMD